MQEFSRSLRLLAVDDDAASAELIVRVAEAEPVGLTVACTQQKPLDFNKGDAVVEQGDGAEWPDIPRAARPA